MREGYEQYQGCELTVSIGVVSPTRPCNACVRVQAG